MASPDDPTKKSDDLDIDIDVSGSDPEADRTLVGPAPTFAGNAPTQTSQVLLPIDFGLPASDPAAAPAPTPSIDLNTTSPELRVAPDLSDLAGDTAVVPRSAIPSSTPEHLRLPTIDFSLPSSSEPNPFAPGDETMPAFAPQAELPKFPDMDMPPEAGSGDTLTTPPALPATGDAPPPPPRRADKPPTSRPPRRLHSPAADFPPLPKPGDMSLPQFEEAPRKRNLTLISSSAAADVASELMQRRVIWPFVVIFVLLVLAIGAFLTRDHLIALVAPKTAAPVVNVPPPTPQEQAKVAFADGVHAYEGKDLPKAISSFEKTLALDATFAEAHRSLGIVYATTHDEVKAVDHYRRYLELTPSAPDAAGVKKIVDDYNRAHAKVETAVVPAPAADSDTAASTKGKKGRAKKHGRH